MKQKPQITDTNIIAQSRLFTIQAVDLEFSNGETRCFERLQRPHPDSVMIVPINDKNELVLIREYAVGIEEYELTFPKGFIDRGETAEHAADRELKEEIGFGARQLKLLRQVRGSPAYMTNQLSIMLAQDLYQETLRGDEPEPLEIVRWPVADYNTLLQQPDFVSSTSVAALLLTKEVLKLD